MMTVQLKTRSAAGALMRSSVLLAGVAPLLVGLPMTSASAQTQAATRDGASSNYYYELPNVVRIRPGTMRILHSRCDSSYPMDESMPCGDVTGGPVGGRGS